MISDSGSITGDATNGWTFTPDADFYGDVNFSFSVSDGFNSSPASATLEVTSVNDDLSVNTAALTNRPLTAIQEDGTLSISADQLLDVLNVDSDWSNTDLTISALSLSDTTAGNVTGTDATGYTFTPDADWNGTVSLTYTVTDPANSSVDVVRTIRVLAVNDAPELATGTASPFGNIDEDNTFSVTAADLLNGFSDAESTVAQLNINNLAVSAGSISGNATTGWTYTPEANFNGDVTISYAVTDTDGASTLASYTFNVAAINDAPERVGTQLTLGGVQEDNTFSITAAQLLAGYTDADGDTLSVSGLTLSDTNQGTLTGDAASGWTFTPTADFNGTVSLNYSISDGQGATNSDTSVTNTFQVFSVNDAPVFDSNSATAITGAQEDNTVSISTADLLSGFSDVESLSSALSVEGLSANTGSITVTMEQVITPSPQKTTSTAPSHSTTSLLTQMAAKPLPPSPSPLQPLTTLRTPLWNLRSARQHPRRHNACLHSSAAPQWLCRH